MANALMYVSTPPPAVTGVSPDPVDWLATLTITGTDLALATSVTIGGVAAAITATAATQVDVIVAGTTPLGPGQVVAVTTPGGTDSGMSVTVAGGPPLVTGVAPDPVVAGAQLTISGDMLLGTLSVTVGGVLASIQSSTMTQIVVALDINTPILLQVVEVTTFGGVNNSIRVTVTMPLDIAAGCCGTSPGRQPDHGRDALLVLFAGVLLALIAVRRRTG